MFVRTIHRASISKFLLGFLVASFPFTLADEFTSPSNSEADLAVHYTLGETVTIAWETSLSAISLFVAQWGGDAVGSLLTNATNPSLIMWTIGENDNITAELLSKSSNYVLVLGDATEQTGIGNELLSSRAFVIDTTNSSSSSSVSPSFSFSPPSSSSSAASTSSTPPTSAPTTAAASTSSTPPTSAPTTAASTPSSSATSAAFATGLSSGAKAGIGVGAAVGGLALISLGAFAAIWLTQRQQQKREEAQQQHAAVPSRDKYAYYPPSEHPYNEVANKHPAQPVHQPVLMNELSGTSRQRQTRYELGTGR